MGGSITIMSTMGVILSTVGDTQYHGCYHDIPDGTEHSHGTEHTLYRVV